MRVYISGPMTGYEGYNFPAFNACAEKLKAFGHDVVNPADNGVVDGWTWTDYLRLDIRLLTECDAIVLLPGWEASKGARLEQLVAKELGLKETVWTE